jgi:uncharacterized protein
MSFYKIPLQSQDDCDNLYIIFRPLLGLAFIGNRKMADIAEDIFHNNHFEIRRPEFQEISQFLNAIGFLKKDPQEPSTPGGKSFLPTHTVLLLTNQCQMKCIYCYAAGGDFPKKELSIETAFNAIDIVYQNALTLNLPSFSVSFHGGGEPIMAWQVILEATKYARSKSLPSQVSLTSNGVWSASQCQWIIENIDRISLSIDGPPAIQNRNRPMLNGGPSTHFVMESLKRLDDHKKAYGIRMTSISPWRDLPISVAYLFENTRCKGIQVEPAFNATRGEHALPNKKEANQFIEAFLKADFIAKKHKRSFRYSAARVSHPVATFCSAPYNSLVVNQQDEIVACYEITSSNHELVNLSKYGEIAPYNINLIEKRRENLVDIIQKNRENCRDCFCYYSCAGDCYVRTLTHDKKGGISKQDQRCYINKILTKELLLRKIEEGNGVAHLLRPVREHQDGL